MSRAFLREGRRVVVRLLGVLGARAVIVVCLLVSASVVMSAWRNLWFAARATAVNGVVVRQDEQWTAHWEDATARAPGGPEMAAAQRLFQAVVEFKIGDRAYEVLARRRGPTHVYPLGSRQAVVFPAGQPNLAQLRAELPDFWAQASLLLMGTVVGAGTIRWWWSMARRRMRFRRRPGQGPAR